MDHLLMLHEESLLSPWALRSIISLSEPSRKAAKERAVLCEHGVRFTPERSSITRCAMYLAIAGRDDDAKKLMTNLLRALPLERVETEKELAKEVAAFPEIAPLLELSRQR